MSKASSGSAPAPAPIDNDGDVRFDLRLLLFLACLVAILTVIHAAGDRHFDFGVFYYAAHMVLDGSRHALYDLNTQRLFQSRFHRPPELLFIYPPFALLPFLCIAMLPIQAAFVVWTVASLVVLARSVNWLAKDAGVGYGNLPILLSLSFMPVASNLAHGQVDILILGAYVWTYSLWRTGRLFLGGLVLSIATLKFQLVAGVIAVLFLKRKWREVAGFGSGCALALALSAVITGIPSLQQYPLFARQLEGMGTQAGAMASLRGLLSLLGIHQVWVIIALSVVGIVWAARAWTDLDRGFAAAILAGMLTAYHLHPQDLSLCLLPFFLCRRSGAMPASKTPVIAISMLLIPAVLAACNAPYALLAIPLAAALIWIGSDSVRGRSLTASIVHA